MCLIQDKSFKQYAQKYAKSEDEFFKEYVSLFPLSIKSRANDVASLLLSTSSLNLVFPPLSSVTSPGSWEENSRWWLIGFAMLWLYGMKNAVDCKKLDSLIAQRLSATHISLTITTAQTKPYIMSSSGPLIFSRPMWLFAQVSATVGRGTLHRILIYISFEALHARTSSIMASRAMHSPQIE